MKMFITLLLAQIAYGYDKAKYLWIDGTPMDYDGWWTVGNHPSSSDCDWKQTAAHSTWADNSWHCRTYYSAAYGFICNDPSGTGYIYVNGVTQFGEADSYCMATYGTHLASIHSAAENQLAKETIVNAVGQSYTYIGIYHSDFPPPTVAPTTSAPTPAPTLSSSIPAEADGQTLSIDCGNDVIDIVHAVYGANAGAGSDQTNALQAACGGAKTCSYLIDTLVIGDPYPNVQKTYDYSYSCVAIATNTVAGEAGGQTINIDCGNDYINIIDAQYSVNCGNQVEDTKIKQDCGNLNSCSYLIANIVDYDPVPGCAKDYVYSYACLTSTTATPAPTTIPTTAPSKNPTSIPTSAPSDNPTSIPSVAPSENPTLIPTSAPSDNPTSVPSAAPSENPTSIPTSAPSKNPTSIPSSAPSKNPTSIPSAAPSDNPTAAPTTPNPTTANPTSDPTTDPIESPTVFPSMYPTMEPTTVTMELETTVMIEEEAVALTLSAWLSDNFLISILAAGACCVCLVVCVLSLAMMRRANKHKKQEENMASVTKSEMTASAVSPSSDLSVVSINMDTNHVNRSSEALYETQPQVVTPEDPGSSPQNA